jgi:hypothetical protein
MTISRMYDLGILSHSDSTGMWVIPSFVRSLEHIPVSSGPQMHGQAKYHLEYASHIHIPTRPDQTRLGDSLSSHVLTCVKMA